MTTKQWGRYRRASSLVKAVFKRWHRNALVSRQHRLLTLKADIFYHQRICARHKRRWLAVWRSVADVRRRDNQNGKLSTADLQEHIEQLGDSMDDMLLHSVRNEYPTDVQASDRMKDGSFRMSRQIAVHAAPSQDGPGDGIDGSGHKINGSSHTLNGLTRKHNGSTRKLNGSTHKLNGSGRELVRDTPLSSPETTQRQRTRRASLDASSDLGHPPRQTQNKRRPIRQPIRAHSPLSSLSPRLGSSLSPRPGSSLSPRPGSSRDLGLTSSGALGFSSSKSSHLASFHRRTQIGMMLADEFHHEVLLRKSIAAWKLVVQSNQLNRMLLSTADMHLRLREKRAVRRWFDRWVAGSRQRRLTILQTPFEAWSFYTASRREQRHLDDVIRQFRREHTLWKHFHGWTKAAAAGKSYTPYTHILPA